MEWCTISLYSVILVSGGKIVYSIVGAIIRGNIRYNLTSVFIIVYNDGFRIYILWKADTRTYNSVYDGMYCILNYVIHGEYFEKWSENYSFKNIVDVNKYLFEIEYLTCIFKWYYFGWFELRMRQRTFTSRSNLASLDYVLSVNTFDELW